jgi:hypothetical protein
MLLQSMIIGAFRNRLNASGAVFYLNPLAWKEKSLTALEACCDCDPVQLPLAFPGGCSIFPSGNFQIFNSVGWLGPYV